MFREGLSRRDSAIYLNSRVHLCYSIPVITALVIFIITYIFIGLRQVPRVHIDRPAGALVGAVLMIVFGVLTLDQAFAAIDMQTLLLLVLVALSSGLLSALFVNDTICLLYTPIILEVTIQLRVHPLPYLLALATSSNIGSVMSVTGNPQNMLIGIYSKVPYLSFLGALFPVALAGLVVSVLVIRFVYRKEMQTDAFFSRPATPEYYVRKPLLIKTLAVCAAVLLLIIGRASTERVLEGVDWTLLLFFSGLFVVMHGVEVSGLAAAMIEQAGDLASLSPIGRIAGLSAVSAVLSTLVSNVPAVMLLKPLTESLGGGPFPWLALAMSSTLAGNLTLIGSVANLIVAQQAGKRVVIGFWEYFRVGALITAATIVIGILVLAAEIRIANGAEVAFAEPRVKPL